jgi:hypothetical protein
MIKAAIPGGQKPRDWMWIQYKRAQAAGPQPTRPEPLSVWPSGSASSGTCDHAARRECMLQEVRAGVKWRRTALLQARRSGASGLAQNPQGGESRSGES